jgi:hypothetical protein
MPGSPVLNRERWKLPVVEGESLLSPYFKAFSGMTPTSLAQKADDLYHDQTGYASL